MTEEQIQLQNALRTTFLANLAFLSEYDNELYHRVDELSRMIENGTYEEKYALEFILEDGDFDIYDMVNDKYLYEKKPKKINGELIKKVKFDEKNAIFDLSPQFLIKNNHYVNQNNRFNFEDILDYVKLTQNDIWEYTNITKDFLEDRKRNLKKIEKFIFLGTLLGRHIPKIAKKINSEVYLVLERNLEIFRLSLFTVDYTILAKKGVVFSIMDNERHEKEKINKFLNANCLENYLIKFSTTEINITNYIDNILASLLNMSASVFDYNRNLYIYVNRTTKILNSDYKILLFNKIKEKSNIFNDIPILYLAAGPSLDENINWIKKNQNKFFIVTIGAAYKKLLNNNIRIDMISTLDEQEILSNIQFDNDSVSKISKNTVILASVITSENVLKKFYSNNLFLYEMFRPFHIKNIAFSGFSVGEITLDILLHMNAKEIYVIGLDLALNQITGDTHSKESGSGISKLNLTKKQSRDSFDFKKDLIRVKGNYYDEVLTIPMFYISINNIEKKISKFDSVKIFNLSNHGAYFEGTIPKRIEDLDLERLKFIDIDYDILITFLNQNSANKVSEELKEKLIYEIVFVQEDLKIILNELIINNNLKTFDMLFKEIYEIFILIHEKRCHILSRIIGNYFENFIPYLIYHFNDNKVKEETHKTERIKKIFVKQMKRILDDYILCLERLVK